MTSPNQGLFLPRSRETLGTRLTESMVARTERSKARQKRKNEQALAELAAKLQAIDVDGERIRNIDFHEEEENQLSEVVEQQEQQRNIESLELDFE